MKPLLILSLLAICAGCKEDTPPHMSTTNTTVYLPANITMPRDQFDDVIKAMRLLAAHADPSPQYGTVNAVLLPRSEQMLIEAKRQEAREAEYAWAKSVLAELEKRK